MLAALNRVQPIDTMRMLVDVSWGIALAYLLATTWLVEPMHVVGSSMAPALRGAHADVTCAVCLTRFSIGLDDPASDFRAAVCPCCGDHGQRLDQSPVTAADRLLVNRSAWLMRRPTRGEVVALRQPQRSSSLAVKRIVGLPGESIEIRHGDVFINGQRWCKTLAEQQAVAIRVADSTHAPPSDIPPAVHWVSSSMAGQERMTLWVEGQRLTDRRQFNAGPLSDTLVDNQNRPVVGSAAVVDLRLVMRVVLENSDARKIVARRDDARPFTFELSPQGVSLYDPIGTLLARADQNVAWGRACEVTVSLFDAQYLLALDGQTVLSWADEHEPDAPTTQRPLSLEGSQEDWNVSRWELFRDGYYSDWPGAWPSWGSGTACVLGPDEYFVLGDNSRVSIDSRARSFGPVAGDLLLGSAITVAWARRTDR